MADRRRGRHRRPRPEHDARGPREPDRGVEPRRHTFIRSPRRAPRRRSPRARRGVDRRPWTAVDDIEGDGTSGSAPVTIIPGDAASLPTTPIFPDVQTALIVGGVLGLGFGIAFAMIRTASDRRIRNAEEVEAEDRARRRRHHPDRPAFDGDNRLFDPAASGTAPARTAPSPSPRRCARCARTCSSWTSTIRRRRSSSPARCPATASPRRLQSRADARSRGQPGRPRRRRPAALDRREDHGPARRRRPQRCALRPRRARRGAAAHAQSTNLFVLTAGSVPPNPSEVLGSERMHTLLADLAMHATVIIDAPPLLPVTDGAVLTHQADGALVVVSLGKTTYDLLEKALDTLQQAARPRARHRAQQGADPRRRRLAVLVRIPSRLRHRRPSEVRGRRRTLRVDVPIATRCSTPLRPRELADEPRPRRRGGRERRTLTRGHGRLPTRRASR